MCFWDYPTGWPETARDAADPADRRRPLDRARRLVFPCGMLPRALILLALAAPACAPPSVLREPVIGASYVPVQAEFPPLPAIMERTGAPPIALPEPSSFTPIATPRWDRDVRP
jgi:hypothetical protein